MDSIFSPLFLPNRSHIYSFTTVFSVPSLLLGLIMAQGCRTHKCRSLPISASVISVYRSEEGASNLYPPKLWLSLPMYIYIIEIHYMKRKFHLKILHRSSLVFLLGSLSTIPIGAIMVSIRQLLALVIALNGVVGHGNVIRGFDSSPGPMFRYW
jgi:hypothetical protein